MKEKAFLVDIGPFTRRRYASQIAAVQRVIKEKPEAKAQLFFDLAAGREGQHHGELLAFCFDVQPSHWQRIAALIRHDELSEKQMAVCQHIFAYPGCDSAELEKCFALSARSIRRIIAILREYGYNIESKGRGRGGPARYTVLETSTPNV
jgi:NAD-specific glutamate dehydrogenase